MVSASLESVSSGLPCGTAVVRQQSLSSVKAAFRAEMKPASLRGGTKGENGTLGKREIESGSATLE